MIKITLPDGSIREVEKGTTPLDVAKDISQGLARAVISASFDERAVEVATPLEEDGKLTLHTWDDPQGKKAFWHSSAHVMAQALEELYPGIDLTIGPPVDNGFYYDIDVHNQEISEKDFPAIEKRMLEIARGKHDFKMRSVSKADALRFYKDRQNPFKVELIEALEDGDITFCDHDNFTDLCRGGHVPNTGLIKAVKLMNIAGAYWRGDEKNQQLTRIYGVSFPKQSMLKEHLQMLEEAKKRDHRKLGKELGIYTMDDDVGPGLPLWLPNGTVVIEELEKLAKETEGAIGYKRVVTPHIAKESLYHTSGHLPYYEDSMYPPMEMDGETYYLKAMNCPHHHKIFSAESRSYRDLPLRLAEYGTCYRYEQSGELFGLMRVRCLHMNDAHIYCTEEQFHEEFKAVNDMYLKYFEIFGVEKYVMRLSLHNPDKLGQKYVDEPELWKKTEAMVKDVLVKTGTPFIEVQDEAAFYGPKIDVQIWSAIGREFTLATNQVDFAQGRRFGLQYTTSDDQAETPLIIHRAPLGTHERFIGFLLEHYAGKFPVWLAPVQVKILPISEKFMDYANEVRQALLRTGVRVEIDDRSEKIGRKIRDTEVMKIPYMLVIGEREVSDRKVSVRRQGKGNMGAKSVEDFVADIVEDIRSRTSS